MIKDKETAPTITKLTSPLIVVASLVIIIAGIVTAQAIIVQILLGLFISIVCAQPILWLNKKGIPHIIAIIMVLSGVVLVFFALGGIVSQSLGRFSVNLPVYKDNLNVILLSLDTKIESIHLGLGEGAIIDSIDTGKALGLTSSFLMSLSGLLSESLLILLITIFILAETFTVAQKLVSLEKSSGKSLVYLDEIGTSVRRYLSLKTIVSLVTGILVTLWLVILGVDYAILWGLVAFLFNFIPNIGSIIAALPTMLLALVQLGVGGMLWTGLGYLLINLAVGNIIEPRLMGKGLGLSTLVVFLSLIVWGSILGTVGMLLSVPLTMALKIILSKRENTQWLAFLLGSAETIEEAEEEVKALTD